MSTGKNNSNLPSRRRRHQRHQWDIYISIVKITAQRSVLLHQMRRTLPLCFLSYFCGRYVRCRSDADAHLWRETAVIMMFEDVKSQATVMLEDAKRQAVAMLEDVEMPVSWSPVTVGLATLTAYILLVQLLRFRR